MMMVCAILDSDDLQCCRSPTDTSIPGLTGYDSPQDMSESDNGDTEAGTAHGCNDSEEVSKI